MDKWEVARKGVYYYVNIEDERVTIGQEGSKERDQTWAGSYTIEEFLEGVHHDLINLEFGRDMLSDMILTARAKKGKYIGMSLVEARLFVLKLREGRRFSTRVHEREWGIYYLGNNQFKKWGRNIVSFNERTPDEEEILSEPEILETLMRYYSYDMFKHLLTQ